MSGLSLIAGYGSESDVDDEDQEVGEQEAVMINSSVDNDNLNSQSSEINTQKRKMIDSQPSRFESLMLSKSVIDNQNTKNSNTTSNPQTIKKQKVVVRSMQPLVPPQIKLSRPNIITEAKT